MNQNIQNKINNKLKSMNLNLPKPLPSAGSYQPYIISPPWVFISGQVPIKNGKLIQGQIGSTLNETQGIEAAQYCALAILAQLKTACEGDLSQVKQCVRLGGFVNATPDFANHPEIINGASNLLIAILGEAGHHSRFAVGVSSLPRQCAVEIEAQFEIHN